MATTHVMAAQLVGEMTLKFLNELEPIQTNLAAYRRALGALKSGELLLEQVQIMEDGGFRVLPGEPADVTKQCVQELPKDNNNNSNSKKSNSELVTANDTANK